MDIVDRIFELVDEKPWEQRKFAKEVGVTASVVSEWRRRKSASYVKRLEKISEALGTTPQYLLYGNESDKKVPTTEAEKKELTPAKEGESRDPLDARIMDLVSSLSPAQKKALIEKMEFLISMQ